MLTAVKEAPKGERTTSSQATVAKTWRPSRAYELRRACPTERGEDRLTILALKTFLALPAPTTARARNHAWFIYSPSSCPRRSAMSGMNIRTATNVLEHTHQKVKLANTVRC